MKEKEKSTFWQVLFLFMAILCIISVSQIIKYKTFYEESIDYGAEQVVTALEMLVVCQEVGNVTTDEITRGYIDMFILSEVSEQ